MIRKPVAFLLGIIIAALSLGDESTPKTWYQNYCIDNSNISGRASDANDGQRCGCAGGGTHHGPLKTWSEVYVNRLGCGGYGLCPRYTTGFGVAAITYNFISSDTAEYINIETANAGLNNIVFSCALGTAQTVGTGVLSNFTARGGARAGAVAATVASGLNKAAIAGVTLAYNEMVFDSTNSSVFWPYYDITTSGGTPGVGDTWAFSQPMGYLGSAEVTIASGDDVTVYLPSTIQINKIASYPVNTNGGNGQGQNTIV